MIFFLFFHFWNKCISYNHSVCDIKIICPHLNFQACFEYCLLSLNIYQLRLTFCDHMDYSPPGSSVHVIFLAVMLEYIAISFSRGSSQPGDWTCISCISCIGRQILYHCTTREAHSGHTCFFLCSWNRPSSFLPQGLCMSFHAHKIMSSIKGQRSFSTCTSLLKVMSSERSFLPSNLKRAALRDDSSYIISLECVSCFPVIFVYFSVLHVCVLSPSVMSDSLWPLGPQLARLLCSWDFPGKNTSGDLPNPGIEAASLMPPALAGRFFTTAPPGKPLFICLLVQCFSSLTLTGRILSELVIITFHNVWHIVSAQ